MGERPEGPVPAIILLEKQKMKVFTFYRVTLMGNRPQNPYSRCYGRITGSSVID